MRNLLPQWQINYSATATSWPYQSATVCKDKWQGNHLKENHYGTLPCCVITFISAWEITLKLLVLHWEAMFWLGPAKMKKSLPAFFKAFLGQFAFQRHPRLQWRAAPEAVGTIDLLLIRESNQEERDRFLAGGGLGGCEHWDSQGLERVPAGSHAGNIGAAHHPAHHWLSTGWKEESEFYTPSTRWSKFQTKTLLFHVVIFAFNVLLN